MRLSRGGGQWILPNAGRSVGWDEENVDDAPLLLGWGFVVQNLWEDVAAGRLIVGRIQRILPDAGRSVVCNEKNVDEETAALHNVEYLIL